MFLSCGLFADTKCPFTGHEFCERPHCSFQHVPQRRDFSASSPRAAGVHAAALEPRHSSACGASWSNDTRNISFQELERINKEIEAVQHEMEQEQKRLSYLESSQSVTNIVPNLSVSVTEGKPVDRSFYKVPSYSDLNISYSRTSKYVVDKSKPRTDLEYDPLSNFSADMRSHSSSKGQKVKNVRGWCGEPVPCDLKKQIGNAPSPQTPSPDPFIDGELIIDIPPSPDPKMDGSPKVDGGVGSVQSTGKQVTCIGTSPSVRNSTEQCHANPVMCQLASSQSAQGGAVMANNCGVESINNASSKNAEEKNGDIHFDMSIIDLTECSEDPRGDFQNVSCWIGETCIGNSPSPVSSDLKDQSCDTLDLVMREKMLYVKLPEMFSTAEKMKPPQSCHFPSATSVSCTTPVSSSPGRQEMSGHIHGSPNQSLVTEDQKLSSKMGQTQDGAVVQKSAATDLEQEEAPSGSSQSQTHLSSVEDVNSNLTSRDNASPKATEQPLLTAYTDEVIIISSSEDEEELNYSDVEMSDSDPMEECYRIFMEANQEDQRREEPAALPVVATEDERPKLTIKPQISQGKKRVAHESLHTEEPLAKSRPQPRILVPFCEPRASGTAIPPNMQEVQQRTSALNTAVKGAKAFASFTNKKKLETQTTPSPLSETTKNAPPVSMPSAYTGMNYLSFGTAVIEVGDNLHFILPEGTFPLPATSTSSQLSSVLTPVTISTMKQTCHKAAVTPVTRYHPTAPLLIPAPTRKPSMAAASAHSNPAAAAASSQPVVTVKPVCTKRKLKQQSEAAKEKVPYNLRQLYVTKFTEEFLKTTANVNEAFDKAVAEEKVVYNRSANKLKYLSVAVNSLKRLKNQNAIPLKDKTETNKERSKGNKPFKLETFKANDDAVFFESLKDYILTEEMLIESNYPVQHPEKSGSAALFADHKKGHTDPLKRICCRCGATYSVNKSGKHIRKEECNYHYGSVLKSKVPGGMESRYSCCQGVMGAPGCQVFKLHVHDFLSLDGFVSTIPRHPSETSCPGVYSLDCETCYTVHGVELSRVTVVNSSQDVVYDTFVRADHEVIDYNTRFSGIGEEDVKGNNTSLKEVQETLRSFISADTILIGHGLESDLCALKLLHRTVVDITVAFPHRLGPPYKRSLNNLTAEYLRRIIQESVCGHDTADDASACMELMRWKVKESGKLKK